MDLIDRLHNCPNCGGTLQDDGACRFCGSRVYDFVPIDLDNCAPSYIRMKFGGHIVFMPVKFDSINIETCMANTIQTGRLEFYIVGDTIVEDTKVSGSEY